MKITWLNSGWIIAVPLLVIALLLCMLLDNCRGAKADIGYSKDSLQHWINKEGQAVASLKKKEADFNIVTKNYLDSIARLHNTRAKDIREAVTIALQGKATIAGDGKTVIVYQPVEVLRDTSKPCPPQIKSLSESFKSDYYNVRATIERDGKGSFVEVQTWDTVNFVFKNVKEGNMFNRKHYLQVDVRNANPHNTVAGLHVYRMPDSKPKKFGIGLQTGYGLVYGADKKVTTGFYAGAGITYTFIRF